MRVLTSRRRRVDDEDRLIIENLYVPMRRFAASVTPPEVDPEDLLQEALVRIWRTRSLHELRNPAAYLCRTMLNLASNHRRESARRRTAFSRAVDADGQAGLDSYPSDLDALRMLTPRARAILYLVEVEGYSYVEVGRMLGCTPPAAQMVALRARRRLRSTLEREE
jgi:RNA polymerase sigma-70 factor (ECF subfamily)